VNFSLFLAQAASASAVGNPSSAPAPITIRPELIPWAIAAVAIAFGIVMFSSAQHRKAKAADTSSTANEGFFRNEIARTLLHTSIGGLILLASLIILLSFVQGGAADRAKVVFDSLLPVFGTWVGTLLAFYFSRANFEAATKSVTELAKGVTGVERLSTLNVKDAMIRPEKIVTLPAELQGKDYKDIPLSQVVDHLEKVKLDRLPLLRANQAESVVRRSNIDNFVTGEALKGTSAQDIAKLSLERLLNDPNLKPIFDNSFALVRDSASLADAKAAMDNKSATLGKAGNCYDVFVTASGAQTDPIIGWITNDIINENAKV